MSPASSVESIAGELLGQYAITYAAPAGAKLGGKLSVATKLKGAHVYAPNRSSS